LEDQVLISWFLAISKLAFTGTFTGSPLFLMGVKTWFTIKFSKQINSAIVFFFLYLIGDRIERFLGERLIHPNQSSVPTGFSLKEARYRGTDMGQIFITLPLGEAGWVKWLVFCGLVVYVGQKMEEYLITQDKNHE
jgi:hypothetical protein